MKLLKTIRFMTLKEWAIIAAIIVIIVGSFAGAMKQIKEGNYDPDVRVHHIGGHTYLSKSGNSALTHAEHCPCKTR